MNFEVSSDCGGLDLENEENKNFFTTEDLLLGKRVINSVDENSGITDNAKLDMHSNTMM